MAQNPSADAYDEVDYMPTGGCVPTEVKEHTSGLFCHYNSVGTRHKVCYKIRSDSWCTQKASKSFGQSRQSASKGFVSIKLLLKYLKTVF